MATVTMGTAANNSLTALGFSHVALDADMASINALIKVDVPPAGEQGAGVVSSTFVTQAFSKSGLLYIPRRGMVKVYQGDYVAVDPETGWPILISGRAAAANPSWVHS